jgi:predicted ATP-dependent protease
MIEEAGRLAADAKKLSLRIGHLADVLKEADHIAGEAGATTVGREHVAGALEARRHRADRIRLTSAEMIRRDIALIDTDGEAVGQINGLSVLSLGAGSFGRPSRITASVRMGAGRLVDIEREVELGGPLHSKGVLILAGYLRGRFALGRPMSLSASLVFEQSYGGVDGDSASSTELYALLSALSGLAIRQSLAVTGSVNQHGRVQAIGGVNEKIEGFFDICADRGLAGGQGVLIPAANVQHLMLRDEVVEAVRAGRFSIHPVASIDEGIALLAGRPAGVRGADGLFPEGSVNRLVEDRLIEFAEQARKFSVRPDGSGGEERRS